MNLVRRLAHPCTPFTTPTADITNTMSEQEEQAAAQVEQQRAEDAQLPELISEGNLDEPADTGAAGIPTGTEAETTGVDYTLAEPQEPAGQGDSPEQAEDFVAHRSDQGSASPPAEQDYDDEDIYSMPSHKNEALDVTRKKNIRKSAREETPTQSMTAENPIDPAIYTEDDGFYGAEDPTTRKRRLLEEKMDNAVKKPKSSRRKADEDDLERMQDDRIDYLKNKMIEAANLDVEKNSQGQIATEKLKLLREVMDTLSKADLAISILDNNLLEAVRLWLEPLPDASMPAYQIQKDLLLLLGSLPIKTDHLVASGIGKVLVFYQRSKRTEANLKKMVDKLIGEWTRPILNKSDSYKDRTIKFNDYDKARYSNKLALARNKTADPKSLYEQQAERRNRAAIPSARTTAYKIAPKVDASLLMRQQRGNSEMFTRINRKMTNSRKKVVKKSGPSIEGKNLSM